MQRLNKFSGQNWLIAPAAPAVGEVAPKSIADQRWLVTLSGIVDADFKGESTSQWHRQTLWFLPDMAGYDDPNATSGPLNWAIAHYGIPKPQGVPGTNYTIRFSTELWAPHVSLGAVFNAGESVNSGFSIETWRPHQFANSEDALTGAPVSNIFQGIDVDVGVRDSDAWLYRLSYHCTLLGRIVFAGVPF